MQYKRATQDICNIAQLVNVGYLHNDISSTIILQVSELLIKHGANVNAMDLWQFTPLHEASSKNRVEVCSLLLAHGGDPTIVNCHSKTAVDVAPTRYQYLSLAICCK